MESRDTAVNQLKSWITANRERLLEAGIASILARYSGEGDSGSLEKMKSSSSPLMSASPVRMTPIL